MAVIKGIKSLGVDGDLISAALTAQLQSAVDTVGGTLDRNVNAFDQDFAALGTEEFMPAGLMVSTSSQLKYNLSGSSSTAFGTLEVRGSNLPIYNSQRGEWSDTRPTITSIAYSATNYGAPAFSIEGSLAFQEYQFRGDTYELANWTLQRLTVGTQDGSVSVTGNLKIQEQGPVLRNGQEYWPEAVVSGSLTGLEWTVLKSGSIYYRVKIAGAISEGGVSLSSITLTEDGVSEPLFNASRLSVSVTEDGEVRTSSGRLLESSEDFVEYILAGKDTITGTEDGDVLYAFAGADILTGGAGSDTLIGGAGKDRLTGGSGADVFKYDAINESNKSAGIDSITDFRPGEDKIDVSSMAFFTAFGSKPTGNATGLLWFEKGSLMGSTNADSIAEFSVKLAGVSSISSTDLVF